MAQVDLESIRDTIRQEGLDGWLFSSFRHRDPLSEEILKLPPDLHNTRAWYYAVPATGEPLKIVHAIEAGHLDSLPGKKSEYVSLEEFMNALKPLAGKRWGVHFSEELSVISYLDAGTAAKLRKAGLELVPAAALIQRFKGLLDEEGRRSHETAARGLYDIVDEVWAVARRTYKNRSPLYEGELRKAILDGMEKRNLRTDHNPVVGAGIHSGDPHYDFSGTGSLIREGEVIQLDLWAKETKPGSIYADISWVGVYAPSPDPEVRKCFDGLVSAREGAYELIGSELKAGRRPTGAMVDRRTREILTGLGYEKAIRHRTGHGIDTECHGSGVNIDSVEFPDSRLLLDGACFSLEPGVYFAGFGLRTEIDVYIDRGKPVISGKERQFSILTC